MEQFGILNAPHHLMWLQMHRGFMVQGISTKVQFGNISSAQKQSLFIPNLSTNQPNRSNKETIICKRKSPEALVQPQNNTPNSILGCIKPAKAHMQASSVAGG